MHIIDVINSRFGCMFPKISENLRKISGTIKFLENVNPTCSRELIFMMPSANRLRRQVEWMLFSGCLSVLCWRIKFWWLMEFCSVLIIIMSLLFFVWFRPILVNKWAKSSRGFSVWAQLIFTINLCNVKANAFQTKITSKILQSHTPRPNSKWNPGCATALWQQWTQQWTLRLTMVSAGDRWWSDIRGGIAWLWAVAIVLRFVLPQSTILSCSSTYSPAYLIFSSCCWSARRPGQCHVYRHDWTQRIDDVDPDVWEDWRSGGDVRTIRARFHCWCKSLCHILPLYTVGHKRVTLCFQP